MRSGSGDNNNKQQHQEDLARLIRHGVLTKQQGKFVQMPIWPTTDPDILNHRDKSSKTPLIHALEHLAKQHPHSPIKQHRQNHKNALAQVNALLDAGADITQTYNGWTPFEYLKKLIIHGNPTNEDRKQRLNSDTAVLQRLKTKESDDVMSLERTDNSQRFLLTLRKQLGYTTDAGGLCNGYAHMAMQAFLVDPDAGSGMQAFEARLRWARARGIENILKDLETAKEKQKKRKENGELVTPLTENETMAESVRAFYDGIELYQKTRELSDNNENLFGDIKPLSQEAELAAPLAMSQDLEDQDGLVTAYRGVGAFTSKELVKYYETIFNLDSQAPVSFTLSAANHAICVHYEPESATFTLIDANASASEQPIRKFVYKPQQNQIFTELAKATEKAFFVYEPMKPNEKLHLSTTLFARASDRNQALDAGKEFAEKLSPYSTFTKADLKTRDVAGRRLSQDIEDSANKSAYAQVKPTLSMTRRRLGIGLLAGLMITAGVALVLLTGGAALPVIVGAVVAGLGVGTAAVGGLLPFLSSDPKRKLDQFAKTRGEVGAVLKPTEAPLTEAAQKRLSSTAQAAVTLAAATRTPVPKVLVSPTPPQTTERTPEVKPTTPTPTPSKNQNPMEDRYIPKPQGPR